MVYVLNCDSYRIKARTKYDLYNFLYYHKTLHLSHTVFVCLS
jgi:hypothetical protein